jgi:peptidoglycan/xylan/chitin deacetylase (PgdA/CDA1 family)
MNYPPRVNSAAKLRLLLNMLQVLLELLSPTGRHARLAVLIFHRVLEVPDALFPEIPCAQRFEREMRWVSEWFNVLPLAEAVQRLEKRSLPTRALAITFDDGYADNLTVAAPILRRLGLTATFFVTSGVLDGGCMWNDTVVESIRSFCGNQLDLTEIELGVVDASSVDHRRRAIESLLSAIKRKPYEERRRLVDRIREMAQVALPTNLMMRKDQVRQLARLGMGIGGHTVTHPILSRLSDRAAKDEILKGKDDLAQIVGERIELFAYPNGVPQVDYEVRHVQIVRQCGFSAAFTTSPGAASYETDRFQLPRFTPWDRSRGRFGLRLAKNYFSTTATCL